MKHFTVYTTIFMLAAGAAGFAKAEEPEAKHKPLHRHFIHKPAYAAPAPATEASSNGWRHRDNARGWDNSCINVSYLPSQFACDAR